jgi:hypothetical protein
MARVLINMDTRAARVLEDSTNTVAPFLKRELIRELSPPTTGDHMSNLTEGQRVRLTNDAFGVKGQFVTIEENDHSSVPYFIRLDNGARHWVCEDDVEAVTPEEFFASHAHLRYRKIEMVKEYRAHFGVGLIEAKRAVESHLDGPSLADILASAPKPRAPAQKHWIIAVLNSNGHPAPAVEPRVFTSASQACGVARIMAEKNRTERFVVYEATDVVVAPPVTLPETQAFTL